MFKKYKEKLHNDIRAEIKAEYEGKLKRSLKSLDKYRVPNISPKTDIKPNKYFSFDKQKVFTNDGMKSMRDILPHLKSQFDMTEKNINKMAMDSNPVISANSLSVFGSGSSNVVSEVNSIALDNIFLGWSELSLLQQNGIIQNICEIYAVTMTQNWITLSIKGGNSGKLEKLNNAIKRYDLKDLCHTLVYKCALFGTSYISPKFYGDEDDLETPLLIDSVKIPKGSLEHFAVIEPLWCYPLNFNLINPRDRDFYRPTSYGVMGVTLDASRIFQFRLIDAVNITSAMYLFGGLPIAQQALPYILDYLSIKREVVRIIGKMRTAIIKTDINALNFKDIEGEDVEYKTGYTNSAHLAEKTAFFNAGSNNGAVSYIDTDEEFTQHIVHLQYLKELLDQQLDMIAVPVGVPVPKITQQSPNGLNATGQFDEKSFHEKMSAKQNTTLQPILKKLIDIIQVSEFGGIDDKITFTFNPLDNITYDLKDKLKNSEIDRVCKIVEKGIISVSEAREILDASETLELEIQAEEQVLGGIDG